MKEIQISNSKVKAIVDDEDHEKFSHLNFYDCGPGYAATKIKGKTVYLHRLVMNASRGQEVDHINHNGYDNRKENLRLCSRSENGRNARPNRDNSTGYKGVSWDKKRKKYHVVIYANGKQKGLGRFCSIKEAAIAYNEAAKKYFGDFAYQNDVASL